MKYYNIPTIMLVFVMIATIGIAVAQGVGVPNIPNNFVVTLGNIPLPQEGQYIGKCKFEQVPILRGVQVYSNELESLGFGNITYQFQLRQDRCVESFKRSFTYSVLTDPVTQIEADMRTTTLESIRIPIRTNQPIRIGGSG